MITYLGDVKLAKWSLLALDRFLIGRSFIHLYINESNKVLYDECVNYLRDFIKTFKRHTVIIKLRDTILDFHQVSSCHDGYKVQQIIKLFPNIDLPYIVIDPKDILINPINKQKFFAEQWPYLANWDIVKAPFDVFCKELESVYGYRKSLRGCLTPQLIDPNITEMILTKHNNSLKEFCKWFTAFNSPSEFYLYDYAEKFFTDRNTGLHNLPEPTTFYLRNATQFQAEEIEKFVFAPDNVMIKIHADATINSNYEQLSKILSKKLKI
jgi:hypothetical protein